MAAVQGLRLIKTGEISLPAEPQRAARLRARLLAPQPALERRIEKAIGTAGHLAGLPKLTDCDKLLGVRLFD
ncbi:hypothetical protein SRHO_G00207450 [Serrasalmus rhombeus]